MEEDLEVIPSESDDIDVEEQDLPVDEDDEYDDRLVIWSSRAGKRGEASSSAVARPPELPARHPDRPIRGRLLLQPRSGGAGSSSSTRPKQLPTNEETPTRPRIRNLGQRRR